MRSLIVANWKMNPATFREAKRLFDASRKAAERAKSVTVVIAPPSIYVRELGHFYKGKRVSFGVQNASAQPGGSYTGEISLPQARDAKAKYVIIGHAERRAMGETNEETNAKVLAALGQSLIPILCVGEKTRSQNGEHFTLVREQLAVGLRGVPSPKVSKVVIAYEPVWAIGAEKPMSPNDMHEMAIFIRKAIVDAIGDGGMNVKILYGGSIDENNATDMLKNGDVVGLLVGRASTDPKKFSALLETIQDA